MIGRLNFDNEMINFLHTTSGSKVSIALLHGDSNIINEVGNFIKRDYNNIDTVTYLPIKRYESDPKYFDVEKGRVKIKIGRFIKKFINEESMKKLNISCKDVENFVNIFKSYFNSQVEKLKIVEGDEILKWYLEDNYSSVIGNRVGNLWNSCMRQSHRNQFMRIYAQNPNKIKMLILLNDDGKLRSRALLWNDIIDNKGNSYNFMDRVYSIYDHDIVTFKSWAKRNGYISKWLQNAKSKSLFDINGERTKMCLSVNLDNYKQEFYPYLDTFKYFNYFNGQFSNSDSLPFNYKLVQSNGMLSREESESEFELEEDYIEDEW